MITSTYKKLMTLILTILVSVGSFAKVEIDGICYNLDKKTKEASLTPISGNYSSSIAIPSSVIHEGITYKVTSIGDYAFYGCQNLTSITIPESIISIGGGAFYYCSGLTSITIPKSVKEINGYAFYYSGVKSIVIPKSVKKIGPGIFAGCNDLSSVKVETDNTVYDSRDNCNAIIETAKNLLIAGCKNTSIPNSVTSLDANALQDCESLTSITIPNSITSIPAYAFGGCRGLKTVTISKSVKEIGDGAFNCCYALVSINLPESVTSIGDGAFYNCTSLKSITIPNSVTSIGTTLFGSCTALESVTIGNLVKSINNAAFANCCALKSITIPNSVTYIGNQVFEDCSNLKSITLGSSLKEINIWSFNHCDALTSITIFATTPPRIASNSFHKYGTLHVLPGCKAAYKEHFEWGKFEIVEDAVATPEEVEDMINAIEKVEYTENCKAKIDAARIAYELLTKEQQALVKNYNILIEAEKAYKRLATCIFNINAETTKKDGKYLVNGKIEIVKNGKTNNINGTSK